MSKIDCIDHVHIGDFNKYIGIYWPLSEGKLSDVTENKNEDNIILSPYSLLIGGGSGEHEAMHIINDSAALHLLCMGYLFDNVPEDIEKIEKDLSIIKFFEKSEKLLNRYWNRYTQKEESNQWIINQNHWRLETFISLATDLENAGLKYPDENINAQMIKVLTDVFGAIIIEKMPLEAIQDEEIKELVVLFKENKEKLKKYMLKSYLDNLLIFFDKPDPIHQCGRNLKIKGNNINTGYSLEDWYRDK